tara:strand:+ start:686 stop:1240 length:555 start_codon:yes stop_codon:yes gene_type:complete
MTKHNARKKKVQARKSIMGSNQPKRKFFGKPLVADLKRQFEEEDTFIPTMDYDKIGVMAVFHHSNGDTNTLRAFGAVSDAENAATKTDRSNNLSFLCSLARRNNLIGNDQGAMALLAYVAQSQTYQMSKMMYNEMGLIMNFYIQGDKYSCRDCSATPFDRWVDYSREMQLTGGKNQFHADAVTQ